MPDRILRRTECERTTGLSESTLWRLEQRNQFPRRRRISKHAIGWLESQVQKWIRERDEVPQDQEAQHTAA